MKEKHYTAAECGLTNSPSEMPEQLAPKLAPQGGAEPQSHQAEQIDYSKCPYCGASRVVRPSEEWQYACECNEPQNRPKLAAPPTGEFTKMVRDEIKESPTIGWLEDYLYGACDRLDAQRQEIERLKADSFPGRGLAKKALLERDDLLTQLQSQADQIKRLNELVFAFESTRCPINPLVVENKAQAEEIERLKTKVEDLDDAYQCTSQDCHRLTAEKQTQTERIERLKRTLKNIKEISRRGKSNGIFRMAQKALSPQDETKDKEKGVSKWNKQ